MDVQGGDCEVAVLILQVQGLMEIFQREWCNIYLWTVNGSAMFHISEGPAVLECLL